ncbi:MAG: c-type cytochrome [Pirellulales bacterium]
MTHEPPPSPPDSAAAPSSYGWRSVTAAAIAGALLLAGLGLNLAVPAATGILLADQVAARWPGIVAATTLDAALLGTLAYVTLVIGWRRARFFWAAAASLAAAYYVIVLVLPFVSMQISGKESWLPVPSALVAMYMVPVTIALALYVTSSRRYMTEFWRPIGVLLRGCGRATTVALVVLPLRVGLAAYEAAAPEVASPTTARTQHPSQYPSCYRGLTNPFRNPSPRDVAQFIEDVRADALTPIGRLSEVHDPTIDALRAQLRAGSELDPDLARRALVAFYVAEGRALYQKNCRACHGTKATGAGPMARGFRPQPINFRELGTIEILPEESYLLWRMEEGGIGLPAVSTPWDSAMPPWKHDFDPQDPEMRAMLWKIAMAEFRIADKAPRQLEGTAGQRPPADSPEAR